MKHLKHFITGSPKSYTLGRPRREDLSHLDEMSIMGYDHEVTRWLRHERATKPIRRIEKR